MEKSDDEDLLPEDYLIQILVWLPVVSLLRFKSVCKSWRALIQGSFFIDLHTTTTTTTSSSKFGSFIVHAEVSKPKPSNEVIGNNRFLIGNHRFLIENTVIMLSSESESRSGGWGWITDGDNKSYDHDHVFKVDNNLVVGASNLGFPSCYKTSTFIPTHRLVGSCNGLICLFNGQLFDGSSMEFSLWNPATRQFRILPKSIIIQNEDADQYDSYEDANIYHYLFAFGFDVETKDYKVVLVTGFKPKKWSGGEPMECPCRIQVYSLITDSWRVLEGITSLPGFPFVGTFEGQYLNGSCSFIAKFHPTDPQMYFPKNNRFIISFDLTKEIITTIEIPDHDRNQTLYLSYMGDKMALFTVCSPYLIFDGVNYTECENFDHEDYGMWVLNELIRSSNSNVNKESWTKLHSFQIKTTTPNELNIPKGISDDGEFALLDTTVPGFSKRNMKLYNLVTKEVKKEFLCCRRVVSRAAYVYEPSLVSIIGGNGCSSSSRSIG